MARATIIVAERKAGDTPKAKAAIAKDLGMAYTDLLEQSICWVPVALTTETKYLLADVAAARNIGNDVTVHPTKVHAILADLCQKAIEANRIAFQEEAKAIVRQAAIEKDQPALEREVALLERRIATAQAALKAQIDAKKKA